VLSVERGVLLDATSLHKTMCAASLHPLLTQRNFLIAFWHARGIVFQEPVSMTIGSGLLAHIPHFRLVQWRHKMRFKTSSSLFPRNVNIHPSLHHADIEGVQNITST
jgi:hypothetical protein